VWDSVLIKAIGPFALLRSACVFFLAAFTDTNVARSGGYIFLTIVDIASGRRILGTEYGGPIVFAAWPSSVGHGSKLRSTSMSSRDFRSYARMARPIFSERDYDTVKKLVTERARAFFFLEAERLEALIRELTDYEGRFAQTDALYVGWAECTFVPRGEDDGRPRRRWSDASRQG
jgi:hypothetical protein